jgi:signal transduction histidine kinase
VVETHIAAGLPFVHADPGMVEQVLMNLAVNARDAMPAGGRLVVGLEAVTVDERQGALHQGATPGGYLCLSVSDTGCGISAEVLPRIFEPFFTTKAAGNGTGLGLATVLGIVQQHQGWVEVESLIGQGTTFKSFLPALPGRAAPATNAAAAS